MGNATLMNGNDNNSDDQTATLVISGMVIVIAVISVILRLYVRIYTRVGIGWDDGFIIAAVVITVCTAIILLWGMISSFLGEKSLILMTPCHSTSFGAVNMVWCI